MNPTTKEKTEFKAFRAKILQYGILVAVLMEVCSIPLIGWETGFFIGLSAGTAVAVLNLFLLSYTIAKAVESRQGTILTFASYVFRLALYGVAFFFSYRMGVLSGVATLLGFMTIKLGILYVHGLKPKFGTNAPKQESESPNENKSQDVEED